MERVYTMVEDTLRPCTESDANPEALLELAQMRMPYGTHKGKLLIDLPEHYVVWMAGAGFPAGKLGEMLQTVYEIKVNSLEYLFDPLRRGSRTR
jgi:uncharacterized protein (DUF3820 family)